MGLSLLGKYNPTRRFSKKGAEDRPGQKVVCNVRDSQMSTSDDCNGLNHQRKNEKFRFSVVVTGAGLIAIMFGNNLSLCFKSGGVKIGITRFFLAQSVKLELHFPITRSFFELTLFYHFHTCQTFPAFSTDCLLLIPD